MTSMITQLSDRMLTRLVPKTTAEAACPGCNEYHCKTACCASGGRAVWRRCCPRAGGGCYCQPLTPC